MIDKTDHLAGCNVTRSVVERLDIVGPMEQAKAVKEHLFDAGFRTIRSGPYTDREMHPKADMTRFLFVVERVIKGEENDR
jgi:hypothetical protein